MSGRRHLRWLLLASCCALGPALAGEPLRLLFVGDIMLDDEPGRLVAAGGDPLAPFAALLHDADYRFGNIECPIATSGTPLANKIAAVGGGRNLAQAHRPLWIERRGLRIAVLAYNEFKLRSFEAGADWPGIAWSEDSHVVADIRAARAAGADLVIPFMHWGWEREAQASARQRQLARLMIDAGADVVVGGHAHVTQGVEYYRGRLIVYSLGNFVFDGFDYAAARSGWVLRLTLDGSGLLAWDTVTAHIDDDGTPQPLAGSTAPCGRRGDPLIRDCRWP